MANREPIFIEGFYSARLSGSILEFESDDLINTVFKGTNSQNETLKISVILKVSLLLLCCYLSDTAGIYGTNA